MKIIKLTKDKETIVDDDMYEYLNQWKWHTKPDTNTFYAARIVIHNNGKRETIFMHNLINIPNNGLKNDHINGNALDNRRINLRLSTASQNGANKGKRKSNKSGFKGVYFHKHVGKYGAAICINYKQKHLGYFSTAKDAAIAYNQKATELFGEFAKLNEVF